MGLRKGLPVKLGMTDADDTRYDFRNLVVCNTDGRARGGVTSPVGAPLLSSTATMNVAVAAFNGVAARDGGVVLLSNDGVANVLLDPAPSSQSRLDVIFAKQNDSSSTVSVPDSDDLPDFGVLKGVASANPVRNPAGLPAGALELGTVLVPSTATTTSSPGVVITTTCSYSAAPGGSVPFRSFAELQAWTTAGLNQRANVFGDADASKNGDYVWSGLTWAGDFQAADIPASAFSSGWTSLTGGHKARVRAQGMRSELAGAIRFGSGANYNSMFQVPAQFAPTTPDVQFIGTAVFSTGSGNAVVGALTITNGLVGFAGAGYSTGSNPAGAIITLAGCGWWRD